MAIVIDSSFCKFLNRNNHVFFYPNWPIPSSKIAKAIFLATCQLVKAIEKESFKAILVDLYSEKENNNVFLN